MPRGCIDLDALVAHPPVDLPLPPDGFDRCGSDDHKQPCVLDLDFGHVDRKSPIGQFVDPVAKPFVICLCPDHCSIGSDAHDKRTSARRVRHASCLTGELARSVLIAGGARAEYPGSVAAACLLLEVDGLPLRSLVNGLASLHPVEQAECLSTHGVASESYGHGEIMPRPIILRDH